MTCLIELQLGNAYSFSDLLQALVQSCVHLLESGITLVEVEDVGIASILLHQLLNERMHLDLDVGIIAATILRFGSVVLYNAFLENGGIVEVCRIHSHQAERENEAVAGQLGTAFRVDALVMVNLQDVLYRQSSHSLFQYLFGCLVT